MESKKYDAFVSYSAKDHVVAKLVVNWLSERGLEIWYDEWEILVGHDIIHKVYEGIRSSRFLVVLLSEESIRSNWVQQEINAARIQEIESRATMILPVIIESEAKAHIPDSLRTKKYADLAGDFETAMKQIEYAISIMQPVDQSPVVISRSQNSLNISEFLETVTHDLDTNGWREGEPFKQVLITPHSRLPFISKQELEQVVDRSTVEMSGYGGPSFPHRRTYGSVRQIYHANGLAIVDDRIWPYRDWSFYYWYLSQDGCFLQRKSLEEDHATDRIPHGTFSVDWLELLVAQALLFASRLAQNVTDYHQAKLEISLRGMADRRLILLNPKRVDFMCDYVSSDDEIKSETIVDAQSDLLTEGLGIMTDIVWRFGWTQSNEEMFRQDMTSLLAGRFPR